MDLCELLQIGQFYDYLYLGRDVQQRVSVVSLNFLLLMIIFKS